MLDTTIAIIAKRTQEIDDAERAGDMDLMDRLLKARGARILEALEMGAEPAYLSEITGNGR